MNSTSSHHTPSSLPVGELKNRTGYPPDKNDVIVFFAKLLDYLARNPSLLHKDVLPVFMTTTHFEMTGLSACIGLGVHPVAPGLRPLPILIDSAQAMDAALQHGLSVTQLVRDQFGDFSARLNQIHVALADSWLSNRCGYQADDRIVVKAIPSYDVSMMNGVLRQLNADCTPLLAAMRQARERAAL
jgi:hypothetical protein